MKKLLIGTALLFAALPFTFDGVTPTISKAHAGPYAYGFGYGYHPCALTLSCSPWRGGGFLDSVAVAGLHGVPWGGWRGRGWNRPFLGVGLGFAGGHPLYGGWGGWGWRRRWW
jgi:hypothetical protein